MSGKRSLLLPLGAYKGALPAPEQVKNTAVVSLKIITSPRVDTCTAAEAAAADAAAADKWPCGEKKNHLISSLGPAQHGSESVEWLQDSRTGPTGGGISTVAFFFV